MAPRSAEDLFDSALTLEEKHIADGYEEGVKDGRRAGHTEGRTLGLQKGFEVGHELGYYHGCLELWRQLEARPGGGWLFGERAARGMAALRAQLDTFPLSDPQDERLQELMDRVRGRFKAVVAALGLPPDAYTPPAQQLRAGQQQF
eukprot:scaffold7.g3660.t1